MTEEFEEALTKLIHDMIGHGGFQILPGSVMEKRILDLFPAWKNPNAVKE